MQFQLTAFTVILFLTFLLATALTFMSIRRITTAGSVTMTVMLAFVALYTFASVLESSAIGVPAKVFFSKIQVVGFSGMAALLLMFSLQYTHQDSWMRKGRWVLLWILPVLSIVTAWTNELHHYYWGGFTPLNEPGNILLYDHGPAYHAAMGFVYVYIASALFFMFQNSRRASGVQRRHLYLMIAAVLIPLLSSFLYMLRPAFLRGFDSTPISILGTVLILLLAISRDGLLTLVPIDRSELIECMDDGILVVGADGLIIDQNSAAAMFPGIAGNQIGAKAGDVLERYSGVSAAIQQRDQARFEIAVEGENLHAVMVRVKPFGSPGSRSGTLVSLHDYSHRYLSNLELESANQSLQEKLNEIELLRIKLEDQVVRDPLTGLYNRRYMEETLPREIARTLRHKFELTLAMIDIDHFKEINDQFGHHAGDHFLVEIGLLLNRSIRQEDFVCRYGGEEFLAVFPGLPQEAAVSRMEDLRRVFGNHAVPYGTVELRCTFSAGIAVCPSHGFTCESLLSAADRALYRAKELGRNMIQMAE